MQSVSQPSLSTAPAGSVATTAPALPRDRVVIRVGGTRIIVKPGLIVLLVVLAASLAELWYSRRIEEPVHSSRVSEGLVHPLRWKFMARPDAEAEVEVAPNAANPPMTIPGRPGVFQIDGDAGFTVNIHKAGKSPDSFNLRNGVNLDTSANAGPIRLNFDAQATDKFPVQLIVRDSTKLLWSQEVLVEGGWKAYSFKTTLRPTDDPNAYMTIHLPNQPGSVSFRHINMAQRF